MAAAAANPWVSVVIPTRGRLAELERCLECLSRQTLPANRCEILVCDDGTSAASAAHVRHMCEKHGAGYLRQPARGPAAARNLGVRHARAPIVAFTDSDTLPQPSWLEALIAPFADNTVVGVEGAVLPPSAAPGPLAEAPRNSGGRYLTANIAFRWSTLCQSGGFDERFPLPAFEDVDLALRVAPLGPIVFAPQAVVIHPWRRTTLLRSLASVRRFDWLLVVALRYGCLGWRDRPTRFPRLRVAWSAAVALPAGRFCRGLAGIRHHPGDALIRMAASVLEAAAGLLRAPRWLCLPVPVAPKRFLEEPK
jgi:GT2 family glycosyltransferase